MCICSPMSVHIKNASKFHHIPGNNSQFSWMCMFTIAHWMLSLLAGENHEMSKCGSNCTHRFQFSSTLFQLYSIQFNLFWLLRFSAYKWHIKWACIALTSKLINNDGFFFYLIFLFSLSYNICSWYFLYHRLLLDEMSIEMRHLQSNEFRYWNGLMLDI